MLRPGGNREKGHEAEREVIKLLTPIVVAECGEDCEFVLKRNLEQTRRGGHDILGLDWLALEVKRQEWLSPREIDKWWAQTLRQAEMAGGAIPVLLYRQNGKKWQAVIIGRVGSLMMRVTISFEDFKSWLKEELHQRMLRGLMNCVNVGVASTELR